MILAVIFIIIYIYNSLSVIGTEVLILTYFKTCSQMQKSSSVPVFVALKVARV